MLSIPFSCDAAETGRRLGHDLFRFRKQPSRQHLADSVREGIAQAAARRIRLEVSDRYVRKWLQLRLSAFERGRVFDEQVTPRVIETLDLETCPVLRIPLTHGLRRDSDWSVDRLNNDGAYAVNNLAVMSTAANRAKGVRDFDAVHEFARRTGPTDGLEPVHWLRLATLMLGPCFATRPAEAPCIPLAAPLPFRSVRMAMQQIQQLFTQVAGTPAGKNALIKHFGAACVDERSRHRLQLLAEVVHRSLKGLDEPHDVWLFEPTMNALSRWRETLPTTAWALAGAISARLAHSREVPTARLQGWHLDHRGYVA